VPQAEAAIDQLVDSVMGTAAPLSAVAPAPLANQIGDALPAAVGAVGRALGVAAAAARSEGPGAGALSEPARALQGRLKQGVAAAQAVLATGPLMGVVNAVEGVAADVQVQKWVGGCAVACVRVVGQAIAAGAF
jgi:hypothetical protein